MTHYSCLSIQSLINAHMYICPFIQPVTPHRHLMEELIATEKAYIGHLERVVEVCHHSLDIVLCSIMIDAFSF